MSSLVAHTLCRAMIAEAVGAVTESALTSPISFPLQAFTTLNSPPHTPHRERLSELCSREWRKSELHMRREMSMIAAHAAWHMGHWEDMATYVETVDSSDAVR